MPEANERQLVESFLAGEKDAQSLFVDLYLGRLHEFIFYRCGQDPEEAEEIMQDVCAKAMQNLSRFRGESGLYTWLCGIAKNTLSDRLVRQPQRRPIMIVQNDTLQTMADRMDHQLLDDTLDRTELDGAVSRAMTTLPPHYQEVLWAKYVDKLSLADLARKLDMSAKAVGSLIVRAREAFKEAFKTIAEE